MKDENTLGLVIVLVCFGAMAVVFGVLIVKEILIRIGVL